MYIKSKLPFPEVEKFTQLSRDRYATKVQVFCFGKRGVVGADLLRYLRNIDKYFSDTMNPIEMQLPKLLIPPPQEKKPLA